MTLVLTIFGGLLFFVLIIASVLLHELGHLIPAKLFGVKATQYFAGFGKTIWSKQVGETEYGFKWLPFGGYVRLVGMVPPRREGAKDTWLQRLADGARDDDEYGPEDEGRLFYQKPVWQKLIVMAGGILTNLVLAFLLFWGALGTVGHGVQTTTVATVHECVVPASRADQTCHADDPTTPAAAAGLLPGDQIISFNGTRPADYKQLSELIRANGDREARIEVLRDGKTVALPVVHTLVTGVVDRLDPSKTVQAGFLGFTSTIELKKEGPGGTLSAMWDMSKMSLYALATLPVKTYNVAADLVTGRPRDPNSPMSIVGASRVAGEVAGSDRISWTQKLAVGGSLLGGLNLFLFWLNVVPLPPMDGGHIAGALWEGLRRWVARLRGKPDPGPVDTARMVPISYVIGGLLLVMGVFLVLADIISPVRIF